MKEKILQLRSEGKSYNEIVAILGCSKGTVSYHCGKGQKQLYATRRKKQRSSAHPIVKKVYAFKENTRKQLRDKVRTFHKNSSFVHFSVQDVLEKIGDSPRCALTGVPININDPSTYSFDHIVPRSRGGDNTLDNLQVVCMDVNKAKHNLTDDEFIALCRRVVEYQDTP